jgi:hypothetical protein
MGMGTAAMDENKASLPGLTPSQIVDRAAVDFNLFIRSWNLERFAIPIWSARMTCLGHTLFRLFLIEFGEYVDFEITAQIVDADVERNRIKERDE